MSYQTPFDFERPYEHLNRLFGTQIDTYLQEPDALRKRYGEWVKKIRLEKKWLRHYRGKVSHMTEAVFAARFNAAWWSLFHQVSAKSARWVRKLEAGETPLNPGVLMCVALALDVDELEAALLLEAGGWSGWVSFTQRRLGTVHGICDIVDNEAGLTLDEVKHLLQLHLEVARKEAYRLLCSIYRFSRDEQKN